MLKTNFSEVFSSLLSKAVQNLKILKLDLLFAFFFLSPPDKFYLCNECCDLQCIIYIDINNDAWRMF